MSWNRGQYPSTNTGGRYSANAGPVRVQHPTNAGSQSNHYAAANTGASNGNVGNVRSHPYQRTTPQAGSQLVLAARRLMPPQSPPPVVPTAARLLDVTAHEKGEVIRFTLQGPSGGIQVDADDLPIKSEVRFLEKLVNGMLGGSKPELWARWEWSKTSVEVVPDSRITLRWGPVQAFEVQLTNNAARAGCDYYRPLSKVDVGKRRIEVYENPTFKEDWYTSDGWLFNSENRWETKKVLVCLAKILLRGNLPGLQIRISRLNSQDQWRRDRKFKYRLAEMEWKEA